MSTAPAGLQRQLNALQFFCEQWLLTVNLAKTKKVTFGSRARCQTFTFNGNEAERVQSYIYMYLGFEFHATKNLSHGVFKLCFCCRHTMHAMKCRCAFLHMPDSKPRCKLFDRSVLPILSYASEVWAVKKTVGESAEQLHWQICMCLALEAALQPSLFCLSLPATFYIFAGGSKFFDTMTASTTCLMMKTSFSVPL